MKHYSRKTIKNWKVVKDNLDFMTALNIFKAQAIEGYYLGKGEDTKINENCFNCLMNDFQANELLYFCKRYR